MNRNPEFSQPGFAVCQRGLSAGGSGFHITFPNGWTASVQFGAGNYCEHYDSRDYEKPLGKSHTAEIAAFHEDDTWYSFVDKKPDIGPDAQTHVEGWQTPEQVLAFLNVVASLPNHPKSGVGEEHD